MRPLYLALLALGCSSLAQADPTPPPPSLRLPAGVQPLRHALDLTLVPSAPRFSGVITISREESLARSRAGIAAFLAGY